MMEVRSSGLMDEPKIDFCSEMGPEYSLGDCFGDFLGGCSLILKAACMSRLAQSSPPILPFRISLCSSMLQFIVSLFISILLYILLIATSARFFVEGREVFLFLFLIYLVPLADLFCSYGRLLPNVEPRYRVAGQLPVPLSSISRIPWLRDQATKISRPLVTVPQWIAVPRAGRRKARCKYFNFFP